jgi:hypothetical protein
MIRVAMGPLPFPLSAAVPLHGVHLITSGRATEGLWKKAQSTISSILGMKYGSPDLVCTPRAVLLAERIDDGFRTVCTGVF